MTSSLKKNFIIFSVFWLVALATYSGFIAKWGLRDGISNSDSRYGIAEMLNGTAHKPFVYRQFIPTTANIIADHTPEKFINLVGDNYDNPFKHYALSSKVIDAPAKYKFKWLIVYWMGFFLLLGSLYILRSILSDFGVRPLAAIFAPCIFSLCIPIIQTGGGYIYDYGELFFMSLAVYLTHKNRPVLLLFVVALATCNKESFLFFIPALYPFLPKSSLISKTKILYGLQFLVSISVNLWMKSIYSGNEGKAVEIWFSKNVHRYINPATYFKFDGSYGLVAPKGVNILTLLLIFILVKSAWKHLDLRVRKHCLFAVFINLPLFIVAGFPNEIRALGFLYVSAVFLIAYTIQHYENNFA
jgi:hypothetical protein